MTDELPVTVPSTCRKPQREKVSAVVVTYNRETIVGTALAALAFCDEIVVVDKSSTDTTPRIARKHADVVLSVAWSPVVEDTRAYAVERASHPWILLLDDDECLSAQAARFVDSELRDPRADAYRFARRHYILGEHDERAYYWPEMHVQLFRKTAVELGATVHSGIRPTTQDVYDVPAGGGICVHHLSHANAAQWIEKTNRYTSQSDRLRVSADDDDLLAFAHARLDFWTAQSRAPGDSYVAAVAVLRGLYDIVDRIKSWEETRSSGVDLLAQVCRKLEATYATDLCDLALPHGVRPER